MDAVASAGGLAEANPVGASLVSATDAATLVARLVADEMQTATTPTLGEAVGISAAG